MNTKAAPLEGETPPNTDPLAQQGTQLSDVEALRKELDDARREAAAYRTKLKAAEDATKTEAERLADQLASLQSQLSTQQMEALRMRVAAEHQISAEDAAMFLTADDESTLRTQAKRLAALNAEKAKQGMVVPGEGKQPKTNPTTANSDLEKLRAHVFDRDK